MHGNAKMARAKARHGNVLILDNLIMRCEGDELFLYQGGSASRNEGIQEHDMLGSGCHWNPVLTFAKCGRVTNES
jgi:hypothetical protein